MRLRRADEPRYPRNTYLQWVWVMEASTPAEPPPQGWEGFA